MAPERLPDSASLYVFIYAAFERHGKTHVVPWSALGGRPSVDMRTLFSTVKHAPSNLGWMYNFAWRKGIRGRGFETFPNFAAVKEAVKAPVAAAFLTDLAIPSLTENEKLAVLRAHYDRLNKFSMVTVPVVCSRVSVYFSFPNRTAGTVMLREISRRRKRVGRRRQRVVRARRRPTVVTRRRQRVAR